MLKPRIFTSFKIWTKSSNFQRCFVTKTSNHFFSLHHQTNEHKRTIFAKLNKNSSPSLCQTELFRRKICFDLNSGKRTSLLATPNVLTLNSNQNRFYSDEGDDDEDEYTKMVDIEMHRELLQNYNLSILGIQNILVIQPYYKRGNLENKSNTDRELMMMETLGLVETLEWRVVDNIYMGIEDIQRPGYFGSGQLKIIRDTITNFENPRSSESPDESKNQNGVFVSAVFVSTYKLRSKQRSIMEEALQKPILDRYNIVLQIFKRHARTKEAKVQVQLAEIPYLRSRLISDYEVELVSKYDPSKRKGEDFFNAQRAQLARRERKLKKEIIALSDQRQILRKNRNRLNVPSVAVVGYTNCGKTSLIKALTGTHKLTPKNKLFATLDVTGHGAKLPCNVSVLFLDTVGFISDVPTDLIASFYSTLEDAALADLLIHVRDVSHPDHVAQNETVRQTLANLSISKNLLESMITVGNKIDLIDPSDWQSVKKDGMIPISTVKGYGLKYLIGIIENKIIAETGRKRAVIRVRTGSEEFEWLMHNVTVYDVETDSRDENYSLVHGLLLDLEFNQFKKYFASN